MVFWSREETVGVDEDTNPEGVEEDGLDEKSNRAIHSIMGTFNLTWKEALEEFIIYTYSSFFARMKRKQVPFGSVSNENCHRALKRKSSRVIND